MEYDKIIEELFNKRSNIHTIQIPSESGLYAIFLKENINFPINIERLDRLIYIGKSDNLQKRKFKQHSNTDSTGSSTVRRLLGALLKYQLQLTAIPRGSGKSEKDFQNYCFEHDGELRLTEWMNSYLEVSICIVKKNIRDTEKSIISKLRPVLCLQDCQNNQKSNIKLLRKLCADEARSNANR